VRLGPPAALADPQRGVGRGRRIDGPARSTVWPAAWSAAERLGVARPILTRHRYHYNSGCAAMLITSP